MKTASSLNTRVIKITKTGIEIKEKQVSNSLSLKFRGDGSIVVKNGSTTLIKSGSSCTVKGEMIKLLKGDVVEQIDLVQTAFTSWLSDLRLLYKDSIRAMTAEEKVLITSIKYTKPVPTLFEVSLPDISSVSNTPSNVASKDVGTFTVSDAFDTEVSNIGGYNSANKISKSRSYSTLTLDRSSLLALVPYVSSPLDLVPTSPIRFIRDRSGFFKFEGLGVIYEKSPDLLRHLGDVIHEISGVLKEIDSVNTSGYCNLTGLSDIPVLSGYLKSFVNNEKLAALNIEGLAKLGERGVLNTLDKSLTLREKRVLLPWLYSLLNLNLYSLLLDVLYRLGSLSGSSLSLSEALSLYEKEKIYDLIEDVRTYTDLLHGNLDPTIRESMRQRGITVSENIYCGFDTEYKNLEMKLNKIVSAQWAANSKLVLSLPYLCDYNLSVMNIDSGKCYPINSMWFDNWKVNFSSLQGAIRGYINSVREKRWSSNDICLKHIISELIKDGIPYFIDKEKGVINFTFDRTSMKTYFKSSGLETLNLKKLVQVGLNLVGDDIRTQRSELDERLRSYSTNISNLVSLEKHELSNVSNLTSPIDSSIEVTSSSVEEEEPRPCKTGRSHKSRFSRTRNSSFTPEKISVTTRRNFYIIGHLTQADMSLLSDFETIKKDFDIVNKCMVTLGRSNIVLWGHSIVFRDTLLLAPGGKKSLSAIGGMYGENLQKISLTEEQHQNMDLLLKDDPILFKEYALRDSLISLYHACILEDAHFKLNKLGVPLTLSSLGASNLRHGWQKQGYKGYQISRDYLLGDSRKLPTPKGLFAVGSVGLYLNNYIANYKGGRNESFEIGHDTSGTWYDYDLTAAYTTAMCMMGDPNYDLARRISPAEILSLTDNELLYSYITIEVNSFQFSEKVRYPSIPCLADETITCYPRQGSAVLTGPEYITSKNQGCEMEIQGGTLIPFRYKSRSESEWIKIYKKLKADNVSRVRALPSRKSEEFKCLTTAEKYRVNILDYLGINWENKSDIDIDIDLNNLLNKRSNSEVLEELEQSDWELYKTKAFPKSKVFDSFGVDQIFSDMPFREVISELQSERRKHKKGTIANLLYKEMGNSIYGSVAKGISDKVRYDIKTDRMIRMEANDIANPILASWITSYVRSLLGEMLDKIGTKGGKVVSITTDGFITDLQDLESDLLNGVSTELPLLKAYRTIRGILSGDPRALELKTSGTNLMSWTTRGQLSVDMKIKAITGLQTRGQDLSELSDLISSDGLLGKTITFISESLRSAKDLIKVGGHVTMSYRDQSYRVHYDNKRRVVNVKAKEGAFIGTIPWDSVEELLTARAISRLTRGNLYQRNTSIPSMNKYKSNLELGVRAFVKDVVNNRNGVGLTKLKTYSELKDFINKYLFVGGLSVQSTINSKYISRLKITSFGKVPKLRMVPPLPSILKFFEYVKDTYPDYDTNLVLKKY